MDQYIGKLLDNRYEILELIGTGGMARVYKARCHRLNRLVAIKILRDDLSQDAEFRRRFQDESRAVAMLSHPNIVAVYDVSRSSSCEYIVMELIDGITLKQYMQKKGNKLSWREALHFITQIVKALGHAHSRGIIHRDIKPHNIMVLRDGSVKVADFGIARVTSGAQNTLTQEALGSVHYISPEQARGSHIDARSDLYSAGVVLYEMITGRLPFEGDSPVSIAIQHINSIPLSPRELDPSIPEALEAITMKAMAPNPDNRYLSADEMLADLEEFRKNPNINFDFSVEDCMPAAEEPDNDKTQVHGVYPITSTSSRELRESRRHQKIDYEDDEDDFQEEEGARRSPPWPVITAVVLILVFVGGLFYFIYQNFIRDILAPEDLYPIPSLVGQLYEDVEHDKTLLGDFVLVEGPTEEDDAPEGTILRQDPEADTKVLDPKTQITVTISSGPKLIEMIPVAKTEYLKALATLNNMGLRVATPTYENSDDVPTGYIISALPLPGTPMDPEEDEVELVVSNGPAAKTTKLINFVGQSLTWAQSKLKVYNLKSNIIETYSEDVPAGVIIDQNPKEGTEVEEGSTVNLEVSKGPDPSLVHEVTKEITINLPDNMEPTEVQMSVTMDGETILNEVVDTADLVARTITVKGTGSKMLLVYFNGQLAQTIPVDFDH